MSGKDALALVLAAGMGRRFGGGKLHALYRGKPLLSYVLDVVGAARQRGLIDGGHVVIAAGDDRAAGLAGAAGLNTTVNDAPELGLSHSLGIGLEAIQDSAGVGAALIFLGDQPLVRLEVVEAVIQRWRAGDEDIVRPRYHNVRPGAPGHPALLTRVVWQAHRRLHGDQGFASLPGISSFKTALVDVPGDNPDVDTMADLIGLEEFS